MNTLLKISGGLFGAGYSFNKMVNCQAHAAQEGQKSNKQVFKCGVKQIPHPKKAYKGGEDAYVMND